MPRMIQIADLIAELQEIQGRFGNTCCYVRGLSWGAVALNQQSRDKAASGWDGKYGAVWTEKKEFHEGEPVFLLRASDPLAPAGVESYAVRCFDCGCDEQHVQAANDRAEKMWEWQEKNPTLVKQLPDTHVRVESATPAVAHAATPAVAAPVEGRWPADPRC